jgi:uncharacterized protein (TIGR03435 family)
MRAWLAAFAACAALGQTASAPLSFEVASVKPASAPIATQDVYTEGYNAGMRSALAFMGMRIVGLRATITDNTLKDLIRIAYQVKDYQISGPPWITVEKYEISAVMPAGSDRSQAPEMLRTLLDQRFHLQLRRETRKVAAYALVVAKGGPKLTAVAGPEGRNIAAGFPNGRVRAKSATIATFADMLSKALDRPIVNETGLTGLYDFDLTYSPELSATTAESGPTLMDALQSQLGFKLEKREAQVEVLIVERAEKTPTQN